MSMWPRPFLYRTISRWWPGVLKLHRSMASGARGLGMPKIQGKVLFREICDIMPLREDSASRTETLGDFPRERGPKNLFWIAVAKAAA